MSVAQRSVKFQGINIELEDQKTERRAKKLQRKKAQKMAELLRNEDIKYFLSFLQTVDAGVVRRWISDMGYLVIMYPPVEEFEGMSQEEKMGSFF
jgi:hypothetical protein